MRRKNVRRETKRRKEDAGNEESGKKGVITDDDGAKEKMEIIFFLYLRGQKRGERNQDEITLGL